MRYGEKLATPDTSVGDLIGDVDPIRIAQGRTLGDPETIHFGLVPRTNRGIFAVNELPDLAERIQVALLNVLEERDIQVRGYQLRLPLDLLLVASANPEDYTNRGRIITPLKDRFGAEIRTHYPLDLELEIDLVRQEAELVADGARARAGGAGPVRPRRCASRRRSTRAPGVSARFAIAAAETVAASALRRAGLLGEDRAGRPRRRRRVGDQHPARQGRVRERRGGPRDRDPRPPAAHRDRRDVPGPAGRAGPVRLHRPGRRGRRSSRPASWSAPTSCCARSAPCPGWPRCSTGSAWATRPPAGEAAAGVEFVLEGLHLTRRLSKDAHRRRAAPLYGEPGDVSRQPVPVRRSGSGGPDPLAPPYDVRAAVDAVGARGAGRRQPARGAARPAAPRPARAAAASTTWLARARRMRREALRRGDLDGAVTRAQQLLDQALAAERDELRGRDDDDARFAESMLDNLPRSTARAVRGAVRLPVGQRRGPARSYQQILDGLRQEVRRAAVRRAAATRCGPRPGRRSRRSPR